jgi:DNA repair protein RadC
MIMFHNHPSGNTNPSKYDIKLTKDFEMGGKLLGIQVLDHIIIGRYNYYSFLEHDKMSKEETQTKAAEQ